MKPGGTILCAHGDLGDVFVHIAMAMGLRVCIYVCYPSESNPQGAKVNLDELVRFIGEAEQYQQRLLV